MTPSFLFQKCLRLGLALSLALFGLAASAAPQNVAGAAPGDCKACHAGASVLPAGHPDTRAQKLADCRGCHTPAGTPAKPLAGNLPLGHTHALAGNSCTNCHATQPPAAVEQDRCLQCHANYADIQNKISPKLPKIHGSHMGDLACNLCHQAHKKSENFCSQCHEWKYPVP